MQAVECQDKQCPPPPQKKKKSVPLLYSGSFFRKPALREPTDYWLLWKFNADWNSPLSREDGKESNVQDFSVLKMESCELSRSSTVIIDRALSAHWRGLLFPYFYIWFPLKKKTQQVTAAFHCCVLGKHLKTGSLSGLWLTDPWISHWMRRPLPPYFKHILFTELSKQRAPLILLGIIIIKKKKYCF